MTVVATASLPDAFGDVEHGYISDSQYKYRDHFLSALLWPQTVGLTTATSDKNYAMFFTVIYLLSNKFVDYEHLGYINISLSDLFLRLNLVLSAFPIEYLEDLIHRRLASIRAAYETLLLLTGFFKQESAFQLLITIGFRHDWIVVPIWGQKLLYYAVSMDLDNTVHWLIDKGCRPDIGRTEYFPCGPGQPEYYSIAICEAVRRGNLGCMHLLLDYCDVNAPIYYNPRGQSLSNFDCFLAEFDDDDANLEYGLNAFIQAGADVTKPVVRRHRRPRPLEIVIVDECQEEVSSQQEELRLSVLDYLFYFHRRLFDSISSKLNRTQPDLSRAYILLSLESGIQNLQQYVGRLARRIGQQRLSKFLKLLVAEQFLGCDFSGRKAVTDLKTVYALASCGISIAEVLEDCPDIFDRFVRLIREDYVYNMDAVRYLLDNGAHVGGPALSWLAQLPERQLVDLSPLVNHVGSLKEWHISIAEAASTNDFQAVEKLIPARVGLRADTTETNHTRLSLIARVIKSSAGKSMELPEMLDFLTKKGAPLRLSKRKPELIHLLRFVLALDHVDAAGRPTLQATIQYLISASYKDNLLLSVSPFGVLDACKSLSTFEQLFRHGAQLELGSPLAHWIDMGGGIGLVREMLAAGANPNARTCREQFPQTYKTPLEAAARNSKADIVELLLEEGADVNAVTDATALQAVCRRQLEFNEWDQEKLKIIQLLLARGADVNAAPGRRYGRTALQETARTGDLAAAKLLLLHNPMAKVNAPPCQLALVTPGEDGNYFNTPPWEWLGTALDIAAQNGRLDMVKLLLSYNALSYDRGENGYDGAIFIAEEGGHLAVADLIRQHALQDQRLPKHLRNPHLSEPPRCRPEHVRGYRSSSYHRHVSERSSETDSAESYSTDDDSDGSTGAGTGILPYEAVEEEPEAVEDTPSSFVVHPDVNKAFEAVSDHGVQSSTEPSTHAEFFTAATLDNNTWANKLDIDLEFEGNNVAALDQMYASHQMDFHTSTDLDVSLGSDIRQDLGVQYADGLEFELKSSERHVYEVYGED
jgi:ankyrin repeat protein